MLSSFMLQAIPILALALGLGKALAKGNTKNLLLTDGPEDWPDLLRSGPYTTVISAGSLEITTFSCGKACTLKLYLASPLRTPGMTPRSVPVVLMFSGFQMPASYYASYAHGLASWGFATLQYDLPGSLMQQIVRDDDEITIIPTLLAWLHQQSMDPASAIYEIVDTRRVAGFGHSRGAKLVALALAGGVGNLQAVVMVDPVDMTSYTRSKGYPSAVEALKAKPNKALIIGAGLSGWCNPAEEGWAAFWPVISPGSWLHMIKPAGHTQFLDVKGFSQWSLDHLCGAGNVTHKLVIHLTQGVAAAWLQKTFRPTESVATLSAYLAWASQQTHLGTLMSLDVKTNPSNEFKMNTADVSSSDEIKPEPVDVKLATAQVKVDIAEGEAVEPLKIQEGAIA